MTNYSIFELLRDVFIAVINSDVIKVLAGALIGLLGSGLTNHYLIKRKAKEKKIEILENFQMFVSKYYDLALLVNVSGNLADYFMRATDFVDHASNSFGLIKEEFQRYMEAVLLSNRDLIVLKSDIHRTYMAYKIHFGKDEVLWQLLIDFTEPLSIPTQSYDALDRTNMRTTRDSNIKLIKDEMLKQVKPKFGKVIEHLDEKIKNLN